ncbi:DUF4059 family protein [Streptococcus sp. DD10]|uniref:DUF4059 family protein n=1 Tax=Streptococcus sp. DD10 TaxID=1777878 RepID=UPI000831D400|nr:DUF4059 family protein [Streptococcus sp. DD10]
MLNDILMLYMQSLLITALSVTVISILWIGFRASRRKDKTLRERHVHLYDVLLIGIMVTPVLSFAVMGLILALRA